MKDITRIHIAGVAYNCETDARRDLQDYLAELKTVCDKELLEDIEVRMTELLSDQGVDADGVIQQKNVNAIRRTLGEAQDFTGGSDNPHDLAVDEALVVAKQKARKYRKLYRDPTDQVLSGMSAGIARYFGVTSALARVLLIIITIATSGFALLIYIAFWIFTPLARTSAQRLEMRGEPATVESIRKEQKESLLAVKKSRENRNVIVKIIYYLGGVLSGIAALIAAIVTGFTVISLFQYDELTGLIQTDGIALGTLILAILSGLLLSLLLIIISYGCFTRRFGRKIIIASAIVIFLGLLSFSLSVGGYFYKDAAMRREVASRVRTVTITPPAGISMVDSLSADAIKGDASIEYIVSNTPMIRYESTDGTLPVLKVEGKTLRVEIQNKERNQGFVLMPKPTLTLYGPVLSSVELRRAINLNYKGNTQPKLFLKTSEPGSRMTIEDSTIDELSVEVGGSSALDTSKSTIKNLKGVIAGDGSIEAGVINSANLRLPTSCATGQKSFVSIESITSGPAILNDKTVQENYLMTPCYEYNQTNGGARDEL